MGLHHDKKLSLSTKQPRRINQYTPHTINSILNGRTHTWYHRLYLVYGGALLLEVTIPQQVDSIFQPMVDLINERRFNWLKKVATVLLLMGSFIASYKYLLKNLQ